MEVLKQDTSSEIIKCQNQFDDFCNKVNQLISKIEKNHKTCSEINLNNIDIEKSISILTRLVESKYPEIDKEKLRKLEFNCPAIIGLYQMIASGSCQLKDQSGNVCVLDKLTKSSYQLELLSFNDKITNSHSILNYIINEISKNDKILEELVKPDNSKIFEDTKIPDHKVPENNIKESLTVSNVPNIVDKIVAGTLVSLALLKLGVGAIVETTKNIVTKITNIFPKITNRMRDDPVSFITELAIMSGLLYVVFTTNSFFLRTLCWGLIGAMVGRWIANYFLTSGLSSNFDPASFSTSKLNLGREHGRVSKNTALKLLTEGSYEISSKWLKDSLWTMKPFLFIKNEPIALDSFLSLNNRNDLKEMFFRKESISSISASIDASKRVMVLSRLMKLSSKDEDINEKANVIILPVVSNQEILLPLPARGKIASINFLDKNGSPVSTGVDTYEITRCILGGFTVQVPPKTQRVIYIIDQNMEDISQYQSAFTELKKILPPIGKEPISSVSTRNLLDQYFHKDAPALNLDELLLVFNQLNLYYIESNYLVNFYKRHNNQLAGAITDLRVGVCDTFTFLLDHYLQQQPGYTTFRQAGFTFRGSSIDFSAGHALNGIISIAGDISYKEVDLTKVSESRKISFSRSLELLYNLYTHRSASFREQIGIAKKIVELSKDATKRKSRYLSNLSSHGESEKNNQNEFDEFIPKLLHSTINSIKEISGELSINPYDHQLFEQLIEALDIFGIRVKDLGELENRLSETHSHSNLFLNFRDFIPHLFIIEHTWQYLNKEQKLRILAHSPDDSVFNNYLNSKFSREINLFYTEQILELNTQHFLKVLPNYLSNTVHVTYGTYNPELSNVKVLSNYEELPIELLQRLKEILLTESNTFIAPDSVKSIIDYYFALKLPDKDQNFSDNKLYDRRVLVYEIIDLIIKQPQFEKKLVEQVLSSSSLELAYTFIYLLTERNLLSPELVNSKLNFISSNNEDVFGELCYALTFNGHHISRNTKKSAKQKLIKVINEKLFFDSFLVSDLIWARSESIHIKYICDYFAIKPSEISSDIPSSFSNDRLALLSFVIKENSRRIFLKIESSKQLIEISNCPKLINFLLAYRPNNQEIESDNFANYAKLFANSDKVNPNDEKLLSYAKSADPFWLTKISNSLRIRLISLILKDLNDIELYQTTLIHRLMESGRSIDSQKWLKDPSFSKNAHDIVFQIELLYKQFYQDKKLEELRAPLFFMGSNLYNKSIEALFTTWRKKIDLGEFNSYFKEPQFSFFASFNHHHKIDDLGSKIHLIWQEISNEITKNPRIRERLIAEIGFQLVDEGISLTDTSRKSYTLRKVGIDEPLYANRVNWRRSLTKDNYYYYNQSNYIKESKKAIFFVDCEELVSLGEGNDLNNYNNLRKLFATIHVVLKNKVDVDCYFYFRSEEFRVSFNNIREAYAFFNNISYRLVRLIKLGTTFNNIEKQFYPKGEKLIVTQHFKLNETDFDASSVIFTNQDLATAKSQGIPVDFMKRRNARFYKI
jgi:hypothetical protein